ncbi:[protein-PII] uridylyltransferase [Phaeovulum vinaykumarii]|uniref:Bifunctional uridylyltransferase/uridylyl-removing enzyme n=1 Tax=Phaeovulum vinaykumarii TaxID=407234 RepID=A0A1N7L2X4_9RHOB|nr:[protein-PII] uridylyltransferase [Phaeovulum vinaykumarii]SIS68174.1 UTP--GlnB (protein PII) uridylyltransferase, GlnD [Phaeovulum vinaykumarii]SOC00250.1 UTP--GlnB (protein PII) uridylyltransferase GlnD [Phaeovulum vinaykumarii]
MTTPASARSAPTPDPVTTPATTPPATDAGRALLETPDLFCEALLAEARALAEPRAVRALFTERVRAAREEACALLARELEDHPRKGLATVQTQARLTDAVVRTAHALATQVLHPLPNPTDGERLALLAVGGYGRAEMAPHSDVDLLFLTPWKITPWAESVIESMLYMLWDLRLKVGHASRTVKDCIRLGREDYTIRTALLEHRLICGHAPLEEELRERLRADLFHGTESEFIEAKLDERAARHRRQGGQRYVLEPNIKEGKGGLRDLQTLYWIAKYLHGVDSVRQLVDLGMFTAREYDTFLQAEDFLWAVRCHLHLIAGRASDQLTFDAQVEVARRMGYEDREGRRGVEIFMQRYFRHATRVGELTRIFLTGLEARHVKRAPMLQRIFRRRRKVKAGFVSENNRLNVVDAKAFLADPLNMLRIFEEALRTGMLIHPDAMRLVAANLKRFEDIREDREAGRIFLDLLLKHGNPERALRRMNELGVIAAFIPEFEPVVAMMQFNVYHHYTVDEHTIQCISTLAQIERGELIEELPLSSRILEEDVNRRVLYAALFLHDIGKGRPEDHAIIGAQIARRVAPRLGLNAEECETVEWLVRHHLLMSDMAQKRDLSDPRTLRDFAKMVRTKKRLDLLTVLTVCDIRGVGPGTWNNWKAQLIRKLYRDTATALEAGLEAVNREQRQDEAKRALREALSDWEPRALRQETARHYPPYWQGLSTETQAVFARLLRDLPEDSIRIDLHPDADHDATRACFAMADHPGIFARLSGALALVGANVVDARTYTTKDGLATAAFWIQDSDGSPYEASRLPRLRSMIERILRGEVLAREALKDRDKIKKREREFRFPTHIVFDNEGSEIYTIIEVDTRDRPGLLYDLARALAGNSIYIASAVIATYGAQVVDTFYVKDMFGLKLHSKARQETLEKRLRAAIAEGAERAAS